MNRQGFQVYPRSSNGLVLTRTETKNECTIEGGSSVIGGEAYSKDFIYFKELYCQRLLIKITNIVEMQAIHLIAS